MRNRFVTLLLLLGWSGIAWTAEPKTSENDARFKKWLQQHPEADTDNDGILTEEDRI